MDWTPDLIEYLAITNRRQPPDDRGIVLAFNAHREPILGRLSSLIIGGQSGMGKSSIVAHLCAQAAAVAGAQLLMCDPHMHNQSRGLLPKVASLSPWFAALPVDCSEPDTILERFLWLEEEYHRRKASGGMHGVSPLIVVIDELNEFLSELSHSDMARVATILGNLIRGGTKHALYAWLISHNSDLSRTGGSDVRRNITCRLATAAETAEQMMLLNTHDKKSLLALCTPALLPGEAILKTPGFPLERVHFPFTEQADVAAIVSIVSRFTPMKQLQNIPVRTNETKTPRRETAKYEQPAVETGEYAERIRAMMAQGLPHREIAYKLGMRGKRYSEYKQITKAMGIDTSKQGLTEEQWEQIKQDAGYKCQMCGRAEGPGMRLTKDRIVPGVHGGKYEKSNVGCLCLPCNRKKGNTFVDYRSKKQEV